MHADSSATPSVALGEKTVLPPTSFARIKKVPSPLQDHVDEVGSGGANNSRNRAPAIDCALLTQSAAAAAAAGRQGAGVAPNVVASFTSSLDTLVTQESPQRRQIHPLRDFQKLYKIRGFLGRGSYSVVFQVMNRVTKELKAAKFVVGKDIKGAGRERERGRGGGGGGGGNNDSGVVDESMANQEGKGGGERHSNSPILALPETLVKEIAVSIAARHPNLVHTSDVFVNDVEDLKCRMLRYTFQPFLGSFSTHQSDLLHNSQSGSTSRDSATVGTSPGGSSGSGVQSSARTSQTVLDFVVAPNRLAVEKVKRQLQEGQVQCIIVMELLSGRDLFTRVSRNPLDEARAASYMLDLLLALRYLHSHHIVHRDVKVENMVLDRHDRARLIDYGFCEGLQWSCTQTLERGGKTAERADGLLTQFCGSYHYVAPEVIRAAMQRRLLFKASGSAVGVKLPPISAAANKMSGGAVTAPRAPLEGSGDGLRMSTATSAFCLRTRLAHGQVGYGTPADLWSAGVVMFVLLHSTFPFHDVHLSKLLKLITSCSQQLRLSPLLSSDAKDLLRQLLTCDVHRRLTAAQAVEHPWFKKMLGERVERERKETCRSQFKEEF